MPGPDLLVTAGEDGWTAEQWSHRDGGTVEGKLAAALPAHGAAVYKLSR